LPFIKEENLALDPKKIAIMW